jgi:thiosulfate/3-mercaptopyruvate sulfurtransferase
MIRMLHALATGLILALGPPFAGAQEGGVTPLVDTVWLAERLGLPDLVILDIRNPFAGANRRTYEAGHVPGAVYSNYVTDAWHNQGTRVPATLPPIEQLEALLGRMGIHNDSLVVIVHGGTDSTDFSSAARVYWILRLLGHERMGILDGGYRAWEAAGHPVERGWNEPRPTRFTARIRNGILADARDVESARQRGAQLVDARAHDYFEGRKKAPIVARAGTIPNAVNLEHRLLVEPETGRFVGRDVLDDILGKAGIDPDSEVVSFCNIGHWSASIWFALSEIAGLGRVRLYDGSMADWATSPERPVVIPDPRTSR